MGKAVASRATPRNRHRALGPAQLAARSKRVLVVDDQEEMARALERALRAFGYQIELARDGIEALAKVRLGVDLVFLDAEMPGMDGFEVARRIREDAELGDLPIIMVTALSDARDRLHAVEAGINDFITKPFELTELRVRTASLLKMKEATDALKRHRLELEGAVERRTAELRRALGEMVAAQRRTSAAHLDTITRLVRASGYKDRETGTHIERIGTYCALLGKALRLSPQEGELLRHASPLHDVGKIGIPDAVLLKASRLDAAEWEIMKQHTTIGASILHGSPSEVLQMGETIALSHHERWDGAGYPQGLAEDAIPLVGRICAVADVFDALTTDRAYRPASTNTVVYEMMAAERGKHFEPRVLDVFFSQRDAVEAIQRASRDIVVSP
jgi:cyclic di-GMP phosphodiesterase